MGTTCTWPLSMWTTSRTMGTACGWPVSMRTTLGTTEMTCRWCAYDMCGPWCHPQSLQTTGTTCRWYVDDMLMAYVVSDVIPSFQGPYRWPQMHVGITYQGPWGQPAEDLCQWGPHLGQWEQAVDDLCQWGPHEGPWRWHADDVLMTYVVPKVIPSLQGPQRWHADDLGTWGWHVDDMWMTCGRYIWSPMSSPVSGDHRDNVLMIYMLPNVNPSLWVWGQCVDDPGTTGMMCRWWGQCLDDVQMMCRQYVICRWHTHITVLHKTYWLPCLKFPICNSLYIFVTSA